MSRAEEAAKEIYKDGIQLSGRRDRNNNIVIHPETMVGVLRNAAQRGYRQAEKDIEKRIMKYLNSRNDSDYATVGRIKKHFEEYKKVIMEDSHE